MLKGNDLSFTKPEKAGVSNVQLASEFVNFKIGIVRDVLFFVRKILSHGEISKVYYSLTLFAVKHYMQESAYKNIWCFGLSPSIHGRNLSPRCNGLLLEPLSPS